MDLKAKILQVLELKNFSYAELAKQLHWSEKQLDQALINNTVEIRTLELISKELRISLYSFFRDDYDFSDLERDSFNLNFRGKEDAKHSLELKSLYQEVQLLRAELRQKDLLIEALENQLKKNK